MKKILIALTISSLLSSVALAAGSTGLNTVTASINVRSAPAMGDNIIGHLSIGQQVSVIKVVGDWCQIKFEYSGETGEAYAFCNYLNPVVQEQPTTPTPTPVPTPSLPPTAACDTPAIQNFGAIAPAEGEMKVVKVKVCSGMRYLACTQNPSGNPDLYGSAISPTVDTFSQKSNDAMMDDGDGNKIPRPDCISFEPRKNGTYNVGVYGATADTKTNLWVSSSRKNWVPEGFEKELVWFSDTCTDLTTKEYGPFNSAWGNDGDPDRPFYEGYINYIHGGVDIACKAGTTVKAMCDGIIVDSNDAGGDWGWHTVLECKKGDSTISIAYIHLNEDSVLPIGTPVKKGDKVGTVFPLNVPGEIEHIHLTGCNQSHDDCEAAGFHPERGASRRTEWWGAKQFWFNMDWRTNRGLYKSLPVSR